MENFVHFMIFYNTKYYLCLIIADIFSIESLYANMTTMIEETFFCGDTHTHIIKIDLQKKL